MSMQEVAEGQEVAEAHLSGKAGSRERPVDDVAVGRDGVERERAQANGALPRDPLHGRHRVRMLGAGRGCLVQRSCRWLTHVQHQHAAVVQAHRQQAGVLRVEMQAHYPCTRNFAP